MLQIGQGADLPDRAVPKLHVGASAGRDHGNEQEHPCPHDYLQSVGCDE